MCFSDATYTIPSLQIWLPFRYHKQPLILTSCKKGKWCLINMIKERLNILTWTFTVAKIRLTSSGKIKEKTPVNKTQHRHNELSKIDNHNLTQIQMWPVSGTQIHINIWHLSSYLCTNTAKVLIQWDHRSRQKEQQCRCNNAIVTYSIFCYLI